MGYGTQKANVIAFTGTSTRRTRRRSRRTIVCPVDPKYERDQTTVVRARLILSFEQEEGKDRFWIGFVLENADGVVVTAEMMPYKYDFKGTTYTNAVDGENWLSSLDGDIGGKQEVIDGRDAGGADDGQSFVYKSGLFEFSVQLDNQEKYSAEVKLMRIKGVRPETYHIDAPEFFQWKFQTIKIEPIIPPSRLRIPLRFP
ncbi:MAG: hypothetical protein IPJ30_07025 [Acidobacteria bacterium]|nr:hypothetical protein [Acidobacteriota bacterium]